MTENSELILKEPVWKEKATEFRDKLNVETIFAWTTNSVKKRRLRQTDWQASLTFHYRYQISLAN